MKLFNAIAIYDVYVVADSTESARATLLQALKADGDDAAKPVEVTATETIREGFICVGFKNEKPFVAPEISDEDFDKLRGKTTLQIFEHIYTKRG